MSHDHEVRDTGRLFIIDPPTRAITTESTSLNIMQYDHNSEEYTFQIPRYVDSHDMSLCDRIEVHFDNVSRNKRNKSESYYIVKDITVNSDSVEFTWLISNTATQYEGTLTFSATFICVDEETDELTYSWSSDAFKSIKVLANIKNTAEVLGGNADEFETIKKAIRDSIKDEFIDANKPVKKTINLLAESWSGTDPVYSQRVTVSGITANSKVDLQPSPEQLQDLLLNEISMVAMNDDGVVTVFAIGDVPPSDYEMQILVTEVIV